MGRVGLIQTRGIGDLIIALPIADFFLEAGHEMYWPVDHRFVTFMRDVKPEVQFMPVLPGDGYFVERPAAILRQAGCEQIIPLYSDLSGSTIVNEALAKSVRFDEYKYAVAGVPFYRKWNLKIRRNAGREAALHQRLGITRQYVCVHTKASELSLTFNPPRQWTERYQIIEVGPLTDNPFDWIYTLEHAAKLVLIDSCFANLVDQLNLRQIEKYLVLKYDTHHTPTLINGWRYITGPGAA